MDNNTIGVIHQRTNFVITPNSTARDKRLTLESRGALTYLLSHSKTFDIKVAFLLEEFGIGKDRLQRITGELRRHGYLHIVANREKGRFTGWTWNIYAEAQDQDFSAYHKPETTTSGETQPLDNNAENKKTILIEEKNKEEEEITERFPEENGAEPRAEAAEQVSKEKAANQWGGLTTAFVRHGQMLPDAARKSIGRLIKSHGPEKVFATAETVDWPKVGNPVAYLNAVLEKTKDKFTQQELADYDYGKHTDHA